MNQHHAPHKPFFSLLNSTLQFYHMAWLHQSRESPRLVLVVVCVALLLDNMLLTVVGKCSRTEIDTTRQRVMKTQCN